MSARRRVLLGLGSNRGDRRAHLEAAVAGLGDEVTAVSDVYETAPVGGPDQGPFLNVVVALHSDRSARQLLVQAHALEAEAGRVRTQRWGPRPLDVDILWIDGETHAEPDVEVPHPRLFERDFVMVPLAEVAPDVVPAGWVRVGDEVVRRGPLTSTAGPVRAAGGSPEASPSTTGVRSTRRPPGAAPVLPAERDDQPASAAEVRPELD